MTEVNPGSEVPKKAMKKRVMQWAEELQLQIEISKETFQDRHNAVYDTSKHLSEISSAGPIQALNICMQIEDEFPGKVEEFVARAEESKGGVLFGLQAMIAAYRLRS